jgi:hypothetical protein
MCWRAAGLVVGMALALLLLSCASDGDADPVAPAACESTVPVTVSADEAVDAAREQAAYIIQDGEVRRSSVELASFGQALRKMSAHPNSGWGPDACVWLVILDGLFYAPGPGAGSDTGSRGPTCGRIGVAIRPDTGQYLPSPSRGMTIVGDTLVRRWHR